MYDPCINNDHSFVDVSSASSETVLLFYENKLVYGYFTNLWSFKHLSDIRRKRPFCLSLLLFNTESNHVWSRWQWRVLLNIIRQTLSV